MANAYEEMKKLLKDNQNLPEGNAFNQMSSMLTPAEQPPLSNEETQATEDFYQKILNSTKPQQEPIYSPLFKNVTSPEMMGRDSEDEALAMEESPLRIPQINHSPVVRNMPSKEVEQKQQFVNSSIDLNKLMNDPEMADALERQKSDMLMATLGRSASNLGHALAQVKPQADYFSGAEKLAKADVEALKEVRKSGYDKFKQGAEIKEITEMDDANSELSKQFRDTTKSLLNMQGLKDLANKIPENASASFLQKIFPQFSNMINAKMAQEARKEERSLRREELGDKQEKASKEKEQKFVQGLRKEATAGELGKAYSAYSTGTRVGSYLNEFKKNPDGYKDYASLMGSLKSLQGDDSVVKEAEIKLGTNATSLFNSALNSLEKLKSGKSLQPEQRQQMMETVQILSEAAKKRYIDGVSPLMEQAKEQGINPSLILPKSIQEEFGNKPEQKSQFPRQVRKGNQVATVNDEKELAEANQEGWN